MNPELARQALRIHPEAPLTAELVEQAYAGESAARHPSLYTDDAQRRSAHEWAAHLAAARQVLLAEVVASGGGQPAAAPKKGPSGGAIAGIVVGAGALLLLIFVGGGIAIGSLISGATQNAQRQLEQLERELESAEAVAPESSDSAEAPGETEPAEEPLEPGVTARYTAEETFFSFPAGLESYDDNRHADLCGTEFLEGCWQEGLIVEQNCPVLQVTLGFGNDISAVAPEATATVQYSDVIANGEPLPIVYGNDAYDYGWINDVVCLEQ